MANTPAVDGSKLENFFKEIYQNGISSLLPDNIKLYKMIGFNSRELAGNAINAGVVVARSNGFTFGGQQNAAYKLGGVAPMQTRTASIKPNSIVLQELIASTAATRGMSSAQAFTDVIGLVLENMMESFSSCVEQSLLYGGVTLAQFTSYTTSGLPTGQIKLRVTDPEWGVGNWVGFEKGVYNFVDKSTGLVLGSTDPLSEDATAVLEYVDSDTYDLTFSLNATGLAAVVAVSASNLEIYRRGAYNQDMFGLDKITSNTGTLFGISAAEFSLWKSVKYGITGSLTTGKLNQAIAKMVGKGLGEDIEMLVNPITWTDMAQDVLAQRMFDQSYESGKAVLGSAQLEFVSQSGRVSVIPHNMVKQGKAYLGPISKRMERTGSTDITMTQPGGMDGMDKIFIWSQLYHGFEVRAQSDQSLFTKTPGRFAVIDGIVNGV
jgi:hypothetical protein